ncbi:MAG: xylA 2 [Verrucomicrobia bacterium]|nr:xylA 2 [Verrucomicrobiota bacterium]
MTKTPDYRFSFGPWNINEGADPFGPCTRHPYDHEAKYALYRPMGFEGVQFHDDDVVPEIGKLAPAQVLAKAAGVRAILNNHGLAAEFVAPRLWFAPETIDGGYTSNSAADRQYALDRTLQTIDIARTVGAKAVVLWLAREGTYVREAKNVVTAYRRLLEVLNKMLAYDKEIEIWIEPKPNEPTDLAFVPTAGHAMALAYASQDHRRVKIVVESAHAILANLDPSDEMAFALAHDKLGSVHLNDQNGLKYDQDKNFGTTNLRAAFNQVLVLEDNGYGRNGEFVGLDVKAMRTQKGSPVTDHLRNTRQIFLDLVAKARSYDRKRVEEFRAARDYEGLELYTVQHLLGSR